jgi:His/Glu/Gln/Arg/opine family amino acid ABC transporter permease subunit
VAFDIDVITTHWPILVEGFGVSVVVASGAFVLGLAAGSVVALMKLSSVPPLRWVAVAYIELFRNVPFLIQIFLAYYMLPFYGLRLSAVMVGTLTLGLYVSAYFAEIIRGAVLSVPRGQMDSAIATGMSRAQALRHVIAPQMLGVLLPPLTSQTLSMVKETSLLSSITVKELTMAGLIVQGITFSPIETFAMVAGLYWAFNTMLAAVALWLERVLQPYRRAAAAPRPGFLRQAAALAAIR